MDDLAGSSINFKIPDVENPAGHKRALVSRQPGSSLPSKLVFKDKSVTTIKNIQTRQGEIKVEDIDSAEVSHFESSV